MLAKIRNLISLFRKKNFTLKQFLFAAMLFIIFISLAFSALLYKARYDVINLHRDRFDPATIQEYNLDCKIQLSLEHLLLLSFSGWVENRAKRLYIIKRSQWSLKKYLPFVFSSKRHERHGLIGQHLSQTEDIKIKK